MAKIIELPRLSDTMEEGVVAAWRVKVGDAVRRGQVIAEIETDKATMEFETFDGGTILALVAPTGKAMPIGAPIAVVGAPGEDPQSALQGFTASANTAVQTPTGAAPNAADSPPSVSQPLADASEKAVRPAEKSPVKSPGKSSGKSPEKLLDKPADPPADDQDPKVPASPLARRLAREGGVPLQTIVGSGPHGRVVKTDVERALTDTTAVSDGSSTAGQAVAQASAEVDEYGRPYMSRPNRTLPLTQMRKAIVKRMVQSKLEAPHFYLTVDIDMEAATTLRAQYNLAVDGTKVSYNDMLIAAVAKALRAHPRCNSAYTPEGIIEHGDVHVGVAVALDDGLIVPVVRYAEQKTLKALSVEIRDLGKRAKKKALSPQEMSGSTFTVSNLGMFGIDAFAAVVNPGEGAILAVGEVTEQPSVVNGQLAVRKRMKATMSCDHRVIDGAVGAQFLQALRDYLEHPMRLLTS